MDTTSTNSDLLICENCGVSVRPQAPLEKSGRFHGRCPNCKALVVFDSLVPVKATGTLKFKLNGASVTVENPDPDMSLNTYIRTVAKLKGTKVSCAEGGCGACIVAVTYTDMSGAKTTIPVNSCLRLLASCNGLEVTTVEGIGTTSKMHPVQDALASHWGSQCGGCSTGMVMSMYSLLEETPKPSQQQVEDALDGNICRCTGYRPILAAFQTFAEGDGESQEAVSAITAALEKGGKKAATSCASSSSSCKCSSHSHAAVNQEALTDLEDVNSVFHKPCSQLQCASKCQDTKRDNKCATLMIDGPVQWLEPVDVNDLIKMVDANKANAYMLVCGNTSTGVFRDTRPTVKIDVSHLLALKKKSVDPTTHALTVGSAVTIRDLIDFLEANGQYSQSYTGVAAHLRKVASPPIRSAGSWAGNLMMAHDHADFPSDLFTTLSAVNAQLTIANAAGTKTMDLFSFIKFDMTGSIIESITIPPLGKNQHYASYKIMKRHINTHAYVNAAVVIETATDKTITAVPRMVFAGLTSRAVLSKTAAAFLNGKVVNGSVLAQAAELLVKEMTPSTPPAAASVQYRQNLVQTLLYKSVLSALPITAISATVQSAAVPYQRPISSGTQTYYPIAKNFPLTEPLPKLSAYMQACGEAEYTNDIPLPDDALYGQFALASTGNAVLSSVDPSAALALDGVVDVILGKDMPDAVYPVGDEDGEPNLVAEGKRVMYNGQAIALVVATSQAIANFAATLVTAKFTDQQPLILTIDDAIKAQSFFPSKGNPGVKKGEDIDTAFGECDTVVEGSTETGSQYHFYMETQTAVAVPKAEGYLDVFCATQSPTMMQQYVSQATGLQAKKINLAIPRVGGAYGGKITRSWFCTSAASFAAMRLRKPVKIVLDLHTNMRMVGKRCPFRCDYKIGSKAGKLHAVQLKYYQDAGSYALDARGGLQMGVDACDNAYFCPNWDVTTIQCQTNTPLNTATRAPGCVNAIYFMETAFNHLMSAQKPSAQGSFMLNNLYTQGQKTVNNMPLDYCSLKDLEKEFVTTNDIASRQSAIATFNAANKWRKRALHVSPNKYGLSYAGYNLSVYVLVNSTDGTVTCSSGGCEIGQGLNVKFAQVVAYELGVDIDLIDVRRTNTEVHNNSTVTGGSCTSDAISLAAIQACSTINAVLEPVRKANPDMKWADLVATAAGQGLDLGARGWSNAQSTNSSPFIYNSYGFACNEVEVDVLTGEVQVLRTDILFDCGESLNYAVDIGQVEGGYVMGLGMFLTEEMMWDESTGLLDTQGTWEYKPPSNKDIPIDFRITMIPNAPNKAGVLRSKASGEPPTCMASSVVCAIRNAIRASLLERKGKDPGFVQLDAPLTPEKIQLALNVTTDEFSL